MSTFGILNRLSPVYRRKDFYELVLAGKVPGYSIIHKNGYNPAVGTTLVPICPTGKYQMPTTNTVLEVNSTDANDTAAGTGAQSLIIEGLDGNFEPLVSERATNGLAVVTWPDTFIRVFGLKVGDAGSYANQTVPSNLGELIVTTTGGGATWSKITKEGTYGLGEDQIGWHTIPKGFTGFLWSKFVTPDAAATDLKVMFFRRDNCNVVAAPFSPMRLTSLEEGMQSSYGQPSVSPKEAFPEYTDIGFMGVVSAGTAKVSVAYEILLVDNDKL